MSRYYQASKKHKLKSPPSLEHLEVWANERGDGHVVQHHFDNGDVSAYEFRHPEQNHDALSHLATHMLLDHGLGGQQEEE
jgi:hypothetical protein